MSEDKRVKSTRDKGDYDMTEVQKQYLTDALRKEGVPALQMGPTLDAFRRGGWMEIARALRAQPITSMPSGR